MSNVKGGKSTTMSYGKTKVGGSVNEEEKRHNPFEGTYESDGTPSTPETRSRRNK